MPMIDNQHHYNTALAAKAGKGFHVRADAYWLDLLEFLPAGHFEVHELEKLQKRYFGLHLSMEEGEAQAYELRGFVDAVAVMAGVSKEDLGWLCDAFEWVIGQ